MDVRFQFFGFDYFTGAHEMHHRNPDCNMAQYWMGLDKWVLGTYRSYSKGVGTSRKEENDNGEKTREIKVGEKIE